MGYCYTRKCWWEVGSSLIGSAKLQHSCLAACKCSALDSRGGVPRKRYEMVGTVGAMQLVKQLRLPWT